jgi:hypothetical protein
MKLMRTNRRLALILSGCVACMILAFLVWPREREPEYKEVKLSVWLDRGWRDPDFAPAFKHMGTNALPFLIRAVKYEEPLWRTWFQRATSNWPRSFRNNWLWHRPWGLNPEIRARSSFIAYGILGADADPALYELRQIEKTSKNTDISRRASVCIAFITHPIGPNGIPVPR